MDNQTLALAKQLTDLWSAVVNLALPAAGQFAVLEAAGGRELIDELALEFDDAYRIAPEAHGRGDLTQGEFDALDAIDRQLEKMSGSGHAPLWTVEALENAPEWTTIRRLAMEALKEHQVAKLRRSVA